MASCSLNEHPAKERRICYPVSVMGGSLIRQIGSSVLIPIRMRRPAVTREARRRSPLMNASRTNASRVECIPEVPTDTYPAVAFARYPTAEWAADARAGAIDLLFVGNIRFKLRVGNSGKRCGRNCQTFRFRWHCELPVRKFYRRRPAHDLHPTRFGAGPGFASGPPR
jgi:hypothetical protein